MTMNFRRRKLSSPSTSYTILFSAIAGLITHCHGFTASPCYSFISPHSNIAQIISDRRGCSIDLGGRWSQSNPISRTTGDAVSNLVRPRIRRIKPSFATSSNDDAVENDAEFNNEEKSETTFYSPNVKLDKTRFRYDIEQDDEHDGEDGMQEPSSDTSSSSSESSNISTNEYSFFDEAVIFVRAGSGGQGASTYKKGVRNQDGVADGGNGGRGGDVTLVTDDSLNTLAGLTNAWKPNSFGGGGAANNKNQQRAFRPLSFRAENGADGGRGYKSGKFAKEVVIRVPPGTVAQEEIDEVRIDEDTGKEVVVSTSLEHIGVVDALDNRSLRVAEGGEGGEGSASSGNKGRGVKRPRSPPVGGERRRLKLTLKIVADVAIVAVPNAGKSTLLAAVTRAKPKIANYPFTTVIPNLGVWIPERTEEMTNGNTYGAGSSGLVLCDVPGLIAGAASGVGLGHAFLRHVERCHVILHLIDATSIDPVGDFEMINRELIRYGNGKLAVMPQVVVVNKMDVWEGKGEDWEDGLKTRVSREDLERSLKESMSHSRLMWMSAKEKEGVDDLMTRLEGFVQKVKGSDDSD